MPSASCSADLAPRPALTSNRISGASPTESSDASSRLARLAALRPRADRPLRAAGLTAQREAAAQRWEDAHRDELDPRLPVYIDDDKLAASGYQDAVCGYRRGGDKGWVSWRDMRAWYGAQELAQITRNAKPSSKTLAHVPTQRELRPFARMQLDSIVMSKNTIEAIVAILDDVQAEEACVCAVCFEAATNNRAWLRLPCNHQFHSDCVLSWLRKSKGNTCPMCRFDLDAAVAIRVAAKDYWEDSRSNDRDDVVDARNMEVARDAWADDWFSYLPCTSKRRRRCCALFVVLSLMWAGAYQNGL